MNDTHNTQEGWEIEFDKYYAFVESVGNGGGPVKIKAYKDFITQLLRAEREKDWMLCCEHCRIKLQ